MVPGFSPSLPILQIAFVVPDAKAAALAHSKRYGSGPFYLVEHYPLPIHRYRGVDTPIDVTSAYGWWGGVCCEFVEQHSDTPSAYRDTVKKGDKPRLHHIALAADNIHEQIAKYEAEGCPAALYAEVPVGAPYAIMDTSEQLGFMTELYEYWVVKPLYDMMKEVAATWDGTDPVRPLRFEDLAERPELSGAQA